MQLADDEQQAAFRADLRAWLRSTIGSTATHSWSQEDLRAWSKALHEAGYAGITWPLEHGGRGLSPTFQAIYAQEAAAAGAPDHVNVIGLNMVGPTIIRHGTREQQARYLPRILTGSAIFCQGFSEPDAGSDLAAIRTKATRRRDGYHIDGEKIWSSYAHLADHCLLLARTDPAETGNRGLTCFLLDLRGPGTEVRPIVDLSGAGTFSQILLRDAVAPQDSILGALDGGWRVAMTTLAHERGTFGVALACRLAAAFDRLVATVKDAGADTDHQIRRDVADLRVDVAALLYTGFRALATLERSGAPGPESSILKLRWSAANQRLTTIATTVLDRAPGLDAATYWDGHWQRELLRSRTNSIEGGTSEILRSVVAERVLGLPRSR